jgi:hypothetical protein
MRLTSYAPSTGGDDYVVSLNGLAADKANARDLLAVGDKTSDLFTALDRSAELLDPLVADLDRSSGLAPAGSRVKVARLVVEGADSVGQAALGKVSADRLWRRQGLWCDTELLKIVVRLLDPREVLVCRADDHDALVERGEARASIGDKASDDASSRLRGSIGRTLSW